MPRYAFRIEYHGALFAGWQRQATQPSLQAAVERALSRIDPGPHAIAAAGRTDAGVHATGQVAHADLARDWDPFRLMGALNHHLRPDPVAITACAPVPPDWHARFSAIERRYTYRLVARRAPLVLDAGLAWRVPHDLVLAPMQDAVRHLLGRHDFTTFRAAECQADSPLRTLDEATVTAHPVPGGTEFRFTFRARSFLHSQVRSMVGTLERVGAGAWTPADVAAALAARDRAACGPVCPPDGLVLTGVGYPADPFALPPA